MFKLAKNGFPPLFIDVLWQIIRCQWTSCTQLSFVPRCNYTVIIIIFLPQGVYSPILHWPKISEQQWSVGGPAEPPGQPAVTTAATASFRPLQDWRYQRRLTQDEPHFIWRRISVVFCVRCLSIVLSVCSRCFGHPHDQLGSDAGLQVVGLCSQRGRRGFRCKETPGRERAGKAVVRWVRCRLSFTLAVSLQSQVLKGFMLFILLSINGELVDDGWCRAGIQWSFINNSLQSQNYSRTAKGNSSLDRLYSRKIRKQLVHHKQVRGLRPSRSQDLLHSFPHLSVMLFFPCVTRSQSWCKCFVGASILLLMFCLILAVKSAESQTESFGGADWEGEDPEQQGLLLQAAGGARQTQAGHVQGEHPTTFTTDV